MKFGHMSSDLLAFGASDGTWVVCNVSDPPSVSKQLNGHSKDVTSWINWLLLMTTWIYSVMRPMRKRRQQKRGKLLKSQLRKESGKSSILLDVKPWDDETDMKKLEEAVRSIEMHGLFRGASKLVAVGYGIKKLQIMLTIVDDLVSVDTLIEEQLTLPPRDDWIQSCDIVAFNKI